MDTEEVLKLSPVEFLRTTGGFYWGDYYEKTDPTRYLGTIGGMAERYYRTVKIIPALKNYAREQEQAGWTDLPSWARPFAIRGVLHKILDLPEDLTTSVPYHACLTLHAMRDGNFPTGTVPPLLSADKVQQLRDKGVVPGWHEISDKADNILPYFLESGGYNSPEYDANNENHVRALKRQLQAYLEEQKLNGWKALPVKYRKQAIGKTMHIIRNLPEDVRASIPYQAYYASLSDKSTRVANSRGNRVTLKKVSHSV